MDVVWIAAYFAYWWTSMTITIINNCSTQSSIADQLVDASIFWYWNETQNSKYWSVHRLQQTENNVKFSGESNVQWCATLIDYSFILRFHFCRFEIHSLLRKSNKSLRWCNLDIYTAKFTAWRIQFANVPFTNTPTSWSKNVRAIVCVSKCNMPMDGDGVKIWWQGKKKKKKEQTNIFVILWTTDIALWDRNCPYRLHCRSDKFLLLFHITRRDEHFFCWNVQCKPMVHVFAVQQHSTPTVFVCGKHLHNAPAIRRTQRVCRCSMRQHSLRSCAGSPFTP